LTDNLDDEFLNKYEKIIKKINLDDEFLNKYEKIIKKN
jgi:predicted  nucleic acid-binding Zn-ribbon protein